jgi:hypothetical protein
MTRFATLFAWTSWSPLPFGDAQYLRARDLHHA